jgi:hypothetical protein
MRFFTAVFGESHRRAGLGLSRTFHQHNPSGHLTVFTDLPQTFATGVIRDFDLLISRYGSEFFDHVGGRRNVFKYALFREMQEWYPSETIVWLDADQLIFDDLSKHLVDGHVNVISHGRRDGERVNCGNHLSVPGERYAIGGMFALPPGPALDFLEDVTKARPDWEDDGSPNHMIGDQLILNHLVAYGPEPVHWVSDDRRYIYNLELAEGLHPRVGDEGLRRIRWFGRRPVLDGRKIVLWYWIKQHLDLHLGDHFASFRPHVARRLERCYRS